MFLMTMNYQCMPSNNPKNCTNVSVFERRAYFIDQDLGIFRCLWLYGLHQLCLKIYLNLDFGYIYIYIYI